MQVLDKGPVQVEVIYLKFAGHLRNIQSEYAELVFKLVIYKLRTLFFMQIYFDKTLMFLSFISFKIQSKKLFVAKHFLMKTAIALFEVL